MGGGVVPVPFFTPSPNPIMMQFLASVKFVTIIFEFNLDELVIMSIWDRHQGTPPLVVKVVLELFNSKPIKFYQK